MPCHAMGKSSGIDGAVKVKVLKQIIEMLSQGFAESFDGEVIWHVNWLMMHHGK